MPFEVDSETAHSLLVLPTPAEPRTCSRTTTCGSRDSPVSTAADVPTALKCLSGASKVPAGPVEHGAQTSPEKRGALAPS